MRYNIATFFSEDLLKALEFYASNRLPIVISAVGALHEIPRELLDPGNGPIGIRTLVVRAYSLFLIPLLKEPVEDPRPLIIGTEDPNSSALKNPVIEPLEGISKEILLVSKLLSADGILINRDSDECALKKIENIKTAIREANILYFSGHGDYAGSYMPGEIASILMLYVDKDEKMYFIFPKDFIYRKYKPSYFAFLNACRTARSERRIHFLDHRGGFIHALFKAGFASVIATLWTVYNRSAQTFVETFFKKLKEGSPRDALIVARKAVLKLGHPFDVDAYAFVLYGSDKGLKLPNVS